MNDDKPKIDAIGGQALIEGVMMRGPSKIGIAVRKPDDTIETKTIIINNWIKRFYIDKLIFLRGFFILFDTLILGIKALTYSAEVAAQEEEPEKDKDESFKISSWELVVTIIVALALGLLLFVGLPFGATYLLDTHWGIISHNSILFSVVEGIIRIVVFLLYLIIISQFKDVKRIFQYHGAEHKTVHAHENGEELVYENIKKYTTLHNRCGTAFILQVLVISIIVFSFLGSYSILYKLLLRVVLMPLISGLAYEMIKLAGRYPDNIIIKILNYPGLFIQYITTKEPDEKMVEVAVVSLNLAKS